LLRISDEPHPDPRGAGAARERSFVRILPHRGALVSELSADEIAELFELRALLEPRLLRLSAPRLAAADYAELDRINAQYDAEMAAQQPGLWGELNTRLHLCLMGRAAAEDARDRHGAAAEHRPLHPAAALAHRQQSRTRAEGAHDAGAAVPGGRRRRRVPAADRAHPARGEEADRVHPGAASEA